MIRNSILCGLLILAPTAGSAAAEPKGAKMATEGKVILFEDFAAGMDNWWVEGGERVWIEDGRLHVKADPGKKAPGYVATVWCRTPHPADVKVEFDAHVVDSSIGVNNINFFLCYSDPSGKPLHETRASRVSGGYKLYHDLRGHIFTFLRAAPGKGGQYADGSAKARFRMRRCPGFKLMTESYGYHCEKGVTYHVAITKRGGEVSFAVDGQVYMRGTDPDPLPRGLVGLRTFRTYLWWDNIKIVALE